MVNQERVALIVAKILQEEQIAAHIGDHPLDCAALLINVTQALQTYQALSLKAQGTLLAAMRQQWLDNIDQLVDTSMALHQGQRDDKHILLTHLLEASLDNKAIVPTATTGDGGLTLVDYSAYGVLLIALPERLALETMLSHIIGLLASGNGAIFMADAAQVPILRSVLALVDTHLQPLKLSELIIIESLNEKNWLKLVNHPEVNAIISGNANLLVNQAALTHKKTLISACQPVPVIVDETADLKVAAQHIVAGATFDHNLLFCAEKFIIVTEDAYDYFAHALRIAGGDFNAVLKNRVLASDFVPKDFYGQSLFVLTKALNFEENRHKLAIFELSEAELAKQSYRQYSGLPVLFMLKARDMDHAIALGKIIDANAHFMAVVHSKNIDHLSRCARQMQTAVFVKNAPAYAALGLGGEGFPSMFIANVTGEGPLHPKDYARKRRCVLAEGFLIR